MVSEKSQAQVSVFCVIQFMQSSKTDKTESREGLPLGVGIEAKREPEEGLLRFLSS